jgi:predicted SnoaL-like aldol condensation-catalyzing enzyme
MAEFDSAAFVVEFLDVVWNNGEVDAAARYVTDGYTIHHDPGDPWEGQRLTLEEFRSRVRTSREPAPDQHFAVQEILAGDDMVMVAWLWSGTIAAQQWATSGATVYYLEDHKISGHWQVVYPPQHPATQS